jgi:AcrR family transcriptional regulator
MLSQENYPPSVSGSELALIHAAERLFAQHGVEGVSLRQVNQGAGQKNMSAAHYHFGSKEGLVRAVLAHRMPGIDAHRAELLARAVAPGRESDLRFYLEAYVAPLAEQLKPRPEGNYYLRFLMQYRSLPLDLDTLQRLTPAAFIMGGEISKLLAYLPPEIVRARQLNARSMIIAALADAEVRADEGELGDVGLLCANLVDTMAAALAAPLSAETLSLLGPAA